MKSKWSLFAMIAAIAVGASACKSGSKGGNYYYVDDNYYYDDYYYDAWYDVYGYECGYEPGPGCNYYWDGVQIIDVEDPYYYDYWYLDYGVWDYYDTYGYPTSFVGWAWLSPSGVLYDEWGYALNDDEEEKGRDFIAEMAKAESETIKKAGMNLASQHEALSETSGQKIASTLNTWATLPKRQNRARTAADISKFSKQLFNVDVKEAKAALAEAAEGNTENLVELNEVIAENWDTTPETSQSILLRWYKRQASGN